LAEAKPKHIEKIARSIKGNNFNIKEIQHLINTAKTLFTQAVPRMPGV